MTPDFGLVVVYPMNTDLRLIQIAPGVDAAVEPLLKPAGLACTLGGRIEVAMEGIIGSSDCIRQFLTTESNPLDHALLVMLAAEFNDPGGRARRKKNTRPRLRLVQPEQVSDADTPEP